MTHGRCIGRPVAAAMLAAMLAGCAGAALDPASEQARRVAQLFWVMTIGGTLIWLLVIGLSVYGTRLRPHAHHPRLVRTLVLGGGVALPVLVLGTLLAYGLRILADTPGQDDALTVRVTAERWWWRVVYEDEDGDPVPVANEIRLPLGERVVFELRSRDVIHSFWVPALAGKLDMLPGRVNRMAVTPARIGVFRGFCAEYCGAGHANMGFVVEVLEPQRFRDWLRRQAAPAQFAAGAIEQRGEDLFFANGCGICHSVRGTPARGDVGPDLTHVGSRHTLAAGRLPRDQDTLRQWIRHADTLKPQTLMPTYALPDEDLAALAAYLDQLR